MSGPVGEQLRALAGPELYRRNAFRLTGLPTDAGSRAVRDRRQKVLTALGAGVRLPDLPTDLTEEAARAAFDELADPRRRIVHEVLREWGPDTTGCGCPSNLHADHDQAVLAHAQALDAELDGEDQEITDALWLAAAELWSRSLRRAVFWDHVRYRIKELDDRRLDESVVDALRDGLPRTLVMPIASLAVQAEDPERLVAHARRWDLGGRVVDDAFEEVAEPVLKRAEEQLDRIEQKVNREEPGGGPLTEQGAQVHWDAIADTRQVALSLTRLEILLPENGPLRLLKGRCAVRLNNSAVRLEDRSEIPLGEIIRLYEESLRLESNPRGIEVTQNNITNVVVRQVLIRARKEREERESRRTSIGCVACIVIVCAAVIAFHFDAVGLGVALAIVAYLVFAAISGD